VKIKKYWHPIKFRRTLSSLLRAGPKI